MTTKPHTGRRVGNWVYGTNTDLGPGMNGWRLDDTSVVIDRTSTCGGYAYMLVTDCPGVGMYGEEIDRYFDNTRTFIEQRLGEHLLAAVAGGRP